MLAVFSRGLPARDFGLRTTPKRPAAREKKTSGTPGNMRRHSKLSLVNGCCVLPVYSFSSMSQHQMRRISLTHITKISSSLLGLIGFYTICPGKNDKFNDAHNSSLSHHCGVHVIMKQPETYSPRPYKLILQRKKVDVTQRKTLLEAKPKISKGLPTLSGRVLFPASRYKNGGVFTRLVPFLTN